MISFLISSLCGHNTEISANLKDENSLNIEIKTTCKKVKEYAKLIESLTLKEASLPILKNKIYIKASEAMLEPTCLIPCGVAFASWAELGLISKNLLLKFPFQYIMLKQ
ncbi:MAG: hypothetical protein NZ922_05295 [Candidatus Methanomethyliaceae archaeon]|nr:hypothetical protein [Candidatus Methanomethyliaceae archaeon]MDW7971536.1 hypothetical protein [Nitrososphaerota archaeon]